MSTRDPSTGSPSGGVGFSVEDQIDRFESAWRRGERPALDDFLPSGDAGQRQHLLIELVHADLEYRLKAGEAARVEDYLARYPRLADNPAVLRDLVAAEHRFRLRREPDLSDAEYARRFPGLGPPSGSAGTNPHLATTLPRGPEPAVARPPALPGYEILGVLGRGGMGVVYKARQAALKRLVALKMLRSDSADEEQLTRFRREAEAVARLRHPNIVQVYDVGAIDGQPYLALEYVDGGNLDQHARGREVAVRDAAVILHTLARAIHHAHEQGVIHRDLKPANVLLSFSREPPASATGALAGGSRLNEAVPKITDFGLAKQLDADTRQTRSGAVMGTPSYMAPEQAEGRTRDVGPRTDVYALGAILYELLTGRPPFQGATVVETLHQVLHQDPVPPSRLRPRIHRDLETICLQCLAKQPQVRYVSARALAEDLQRFLDGEPILARREGPVSRVVRKIRRNPLPAAAAAAVLVGLLVACVALPLAYRSYRAASLIQQLDGGIAADDWSAEALGKLNQLVDDLEWLDRGQAAAAQLRVTQALAQSLRERIRRGNLRPEDVRGIEDDLVLLEPRDADAAAKLREDLASRVRGMEIAFRIDRPPEGVDAAFEPGRVAVRDGVLMPAAAGAVPTREQAGDHVEFGCVFRGGDWERVKSLGLLLGGRDGYALLLRPAPLPGAPAGQVPTFAEARKVGGMAHLEILRGRSRLRHEAVPMADLADGPLRLEAVRQGERLTVQVNRRQPLEFRDVFPLPAAGNLALDWPAGVGLQSVWASRGLVPAVPSPLERGDIAFARGDHEQALAEYRAQDVAAPTTEVRLESRFKQALCQLRLNREADAVSLLEAVSAVWGESPDERRWAVRADCHLWLLYLRRGDAGRALADGVYQRLGFRVPAGELAAVVPEEDRLRILESAEMGGPLDRVTRPELVVERLRRNIEVLDLLQANWRERLGTRENLARAQRYAGREAEAARLYREVLQNFRELEATDIVRRSVEELCWIHRCRGEAPQALAEINRWVCDTSGAVRRDHGSVPSLLLERARIHAALGRWAEAEADADLALELLRPRRGSPHWTWACFLKGALRERAGDAAAALAAWSDGLLPDPLRALDEEVLGGNQVLYHWIMAAHTGRLADAEVDAALAKFKRALSDPKQRQLLETGSHLLPRATYREAWATPRGRAVTQQIALRTVPLAEYVRLPVVLLGFELLRRDALPSPLPEAIDSLAWSLAAEMVNGLQDGRVTLEQALGMGLTWKGLAVLSNWKVEDMAPELRGSLAYVFGHRSLRRGNPKEAAKYFEEAAKSPPESAAARLAKTELERLKAKP